MIRPTVFTTLRWAVVAAALAAAFGNQPTANLMTGYAGFIFAIGIVAAMGGAPLKPLPARDAIPTFITVVVLIGGGFWWQAAGLTLGSLMLLGAGVLSERRQAEAIQKAWESGEEHY